MRCAGRSVVVVGADRVAAARRAAEEGAEIVVCDDGLQHLRLARDFEIAVVDAARGLGNGQLLPAGPAARAAGPARAGRRGGAHRARRQRGRPRVSPRGPLRVTMRLRLGDAVNLGIGERRALETVPGAGRACGGRHRPPRGVLRRPARAPGSRSTPHALADHAALDPAALPFPAGCNRPDDREGCRKMPGVRRRGLVVRRARGRASSGRPPSELLALVLERTGLTGAGVHLG